MKNTSHNAAALQADFCQGGPLSAVSLGASLLVSAGNTTTVAYINRQGGLCSQQLHTLRCKLILWGNAHLLSVRARHMPGIQNLGADLFPKESPLCRIETEPSCSGADLNMVQLCSGGPVWSGENSQCTPFISLHDQSTPLGIHVFGQVDLCSALCILPTGLDSLDIVHGAGE